MRIKTIINSRNTLHASFNPYSLNRICGALPDGGVTIVRNPDAISSVMTCCSGCLPGGLEEVRQQLETTTNRKPA